MNKLQKEQLKLHFGEEWDEMVDHAERMATTLSRLPQFPLEMRRRFTRNEGGKQGITLSLLLLTVETKDFDEAVSRYVEYLNEEYHLDKDTLPLGSISPLAPFSGSSLLSDSPLSGDTKGSLANIAKLTDGEREVLETFAHLRGNVYGRTTEVAELLDIPYNTARQRLQLARQKMRGGKCIVVNCDDIIHSRKMCVKHYFQTRRGKTLQHQN